MAVLCSFMAMGQARDKPPPLAPGYGRLHFTAPPAGSYPLPVIDRAHDGQVIDRHGQALRLFDLMGDKIVLLSFIYTSCSNVNGCPLATAVFHRLASRLCQQPERARQLRLISLSFDPQQDTPDKMRQYAGHLSCPDVDWHFLTTASERAIQPILAAYQQNVDKVYDRQGRFTGTFSHLLRVYLIDRKKNIRNIYSVDFLHPETLLNDVETLLLSADTIPVTDNTESTTIRSGKPADLLAFFNTPPLGLPPVPNPGDNPISVAKIKLGRKLFYDRRLSLNHTLSCAICHIPDQGFTSHDMQTAVGIEGRSVRRNSPTIYNVAYYTLLFHDGRENTLEQQVWGPLLAPNEMANPSVGFVLQKIRRMDDYLSLFMQAFGRGPSMETLGMALASYQRTLNSANSAFDRYYFGHEKQALSPNAIQGLQLFKGKAGCSACHLIQKNHALFTDNKTHNTGIGYAASMLSNPPTQAVQIAPGVAVEVPTEIIRSVAGDKPGDLGRYEITQKPEHRWHYKTPSLRNIALTAPYMHNGSLATLKEVVQFYNHGGIANKNLDPLIKPLHLTDTEVTQLVEFLQALTGANVDQLIADAYAAPIGDSH